MEPPAQQPASATPQRPASGPAAPPADGPGDRASAIPVAPAIQQPAEETPPPVRVTYPRLDADLEVVPTGVAEDGQMQIPDDAATAAWYRFGMAPADEEGTTVIAAHAGSESTPEGPLYALREARAGDLIEVGDAEGTLHTYRVSTVEQLNKDELDLTPYFERTGAPRLVLVTCGGQWLPERGSYADNVIVVAEPAD